MGISNFTKILARYNRIGIDAMVLIYFLEDNKKFGDLAGTIFRLAEKGEFIMIFSILAQVEVLTGYRKAGNSALEQNFKEMISFFPNIEMYNVDNNLLDKIVDLRSKYKIRTPDAIHIATAIQNKAAAFITNDIALKKIKEIEIICLRDCLG